MAFCPRGALTSDEWGHPYVQKASRYTGCGLGELLCPNFTISATPEDKEGLEAARPGDSGGKGATLQVSP